MVDNKQQSSTTCTSSNKDNFEVRALRKAIIQYMLHLFVSFSENESFFFVFEAFGRIIDCIMLSVMVGMISWMMCACSWYDVQVTATSFAFTTSTNINFIAQRQHNYYHHNCFQINSNTKNEGFFLGSKSSSLPSSVSKTFPKKSYGNRIEKTTVANQNMIQAVRQTPKKEDADKLHQTKAPSWKLRAIIISYSSFVWNQVKYRCFNTIESAGLRTADVLTAGASGGSGDASSIKKIGKAIVQLHNPITYLVLSLAAGFRWDWCFKSPLYWFGVGFCVKWYRARYVFKIPVWDRQPNWNNIITSKEQEKDLKAYTCKNCGSTIFIAKTREFFFEGNTGFGGLGCFACGAKGRDNFVMDRERIVEDVGDMDDYFEYERPLDFVSRAERRKLLKETQGDEAKANQLLIERSSGTTITTDETTTETPASATKHEETESIQDNDSSEIVDAVVESKSSEQAMNAAKANENSEQAEQTKLKKKKKKKKSVTEKKEVYSDDMINLDVLDMDAF